MAAFRHHLFVCENERPAGHPRGCCGAERGGAVRARFKEEIRARGLQGVVRANQAGCLDQCALGVTVVVYPRAVWYGGVTPADVPEILDALAAGTVVERLVIPPERLTGRAPSPPTAEEPRE